MAADIGDYALYMDSGDILTGSNLRNAFERKERVEYWGVLLYASRKAETLGDVDKHEVRACH